MAAELARASDDGLVESRGRASQEPWRHEAEGGKN